MKHSEFKVGSEFRCGEGHYRCTDIGSRTIIGIRIDRISTASQTARGNISQKTIVKGDAEADGWFKGPSYAVSEIVFDEEDQKGCSPLR
jgi:hypothetical protein